MSAKQAKEQADSSGVLSIRGVDYEIPPPDDLDLGECMLIKEVSGYGVEEFYEAIIRTEGPALAAFALILIRRAGTKVEIADVQQIKLSEFDLRLPEEAEEDPPLPVAESGGEKTAGSKSSANGSGGSEATPDAAGSRPSVKSA